MVMYKMYELGLDLCRVVLVVGFVFLLLLGNEIMDGIGWMNDVIFYGG